MAELIAPPSTLLQTLLEWDIFGIIAVGAMLENGPHVVRSSFPNVWHTTTLIPISPDVLLAAQILWRNLVSQYTLAAHPAFTYLDISGAISPPIYI